MAQSRKTDGFLGQNDQAFGRDLRPWRSSSADTPHIAQREPRSPRLYVRNLDFHGRDVVGDKRRGSEEQLPSLQGTEDPCPAFGETPGT